jgi:hypothetical protein
MRAGAPKPQTVDFRSNMTHALLAMGGARLAAYPLQPATSKTEKAASACTTTRPSGPARRIHGLSPFWIQNLDQATIGVPGRARPARVVPATYASAPVRMRRVDPEHRGSSMAVDPACRVRPLDPRDEKAWVRATLGAGYDEGAFRALCRTWLDEQPATRDFTFTDWVVRNAMHVHPADGLAWQRWRPEYAGHGAFHTAYRLEGLEDTYAKVDGAQIGSQVAFNAQFHNREPDHRPVRLSALLEQNFARERRLIALLHKHFDGMVAESLELATLPVVGRMVAAIVSNGDPRVLKQEGRHWRYGSVLIDPDKVYSFRTIVRLQANQSEDYRRAQAGEDAMYLQTHFVGRDDCGVHLADGIDPNRDPLTAAQYAQACRWWIANRHGGLPFQGEARALFERVLGRNRYSTVVSMLRQCDRDPALAHTLEQFAMGAAAFAAEADTIVDIIGRANVLFLRSPDGSWKCRMPDPMPPQLCPMVSRYASAVRSISDTGNASRSHRMELFCTSSFALTVNGLLHYFDRPERMVVPGVEEASWERVFDVSGQVFGQQKEEARTVLPLQPYPTWKIARPPWP